MSSESKFALKIRKVHAAITLDVTRSPVYLHNGDWLIVETTRGEEIGKVHKLPRPCHRQTLHDNVKIREIIRLATPEDIQKAAELPRLESEYLQAANKIFDEKAPAVKLISCELLFNHKKVIFYYRFLEEENNSKDKKKHQERESQRKFNTKELNKDLFNLLHIPVELKEMGNRASAYVIGGVGHCGYDLCCTRWLSKPKQVSVKMAKEQSLAINIPKLSGVCGKLLCCLAYEHQQYDNGVLNDLAAKPAVAEDKEFFKIFSAEEQRPPKG